jgi:hypothetical protein
VKTVFKRLNYQLSNGLFVVNAKLLKDEKGVIYPVASLFLTDHIENTKILLDLSTQKIIYSKHNLSIPDADMKNLIAAWKTEEKTSHG